MKKLPIIRDGLARRFDHLYGVAASDGELYGRQGTCQDPDEREPESAAAARLEGPRDDQVAVDRDHRARTHARRHRRHLHSASDSLPGGQGTTGSSLTGLLQKVVVVVHAVSNNFQLDCFSNKLL